eukprot:jgi/Phyca11/118328/e_gw1.36.388.1
MEDLGCPPHRIHQELTNLLLLRGYMLPVLHDVMFRLFIGDLTVGSRLYFLAPLNPTIQQCVRSTCQELETTEHCFFACLHLQPLWHQIWTFWSGFFRADLTWRLLLFPKPQDVSRTWRKRQKGVLLLWRIQIAVAFHATWRLRNDIHFRRTDAQQPNVANILSSFKRHYQFIYQHGDALGCDRTTITLFIQELGFDPPKDAYLERTPRLWIDQASI